MNFGQHLLAVFLCAGLGSGAWGQSGSLKFNVNDSDSAPLDGPLPSQRPNAQAKPLGPVDAVELSRFEAGKTMLIPGHLLAGGGLVLAFVGGATQSAGANIAGSLMYMIGVPLTGAAAGKINKAAARINPSYVPEYRGWGWYWTGMGIGLWGSLLVNSGINDYNESRTEEERDDAASTIGGGLLLSLIGNVCTIVAWGKFGFLASEGKAAVPSTHALTLAPQLPLASNGNGPLGLTLGYHF
jgi:hypothetical protein